MRNRFTAKREVKVLTVTKDGKLTIFTKSPVPTKEIKTRHHLQLEGEKKEIFWALDQSIAAKVKAFKQTQKELKELKAKELKRISSNVEGWFNRASKLAIA